MPIVNCTCEDAWPQRTLLDMRTALLRRLGFSAQAANPPPGMAELLDDFLRDAQEQLYRRYAALRTERIYTWPLVQAERFYDLRGNEEVSPTPPEVACTKYLDPHRLTWIGIEDLGGRWSPLAEGISPALYAEPVQSGMPERYEIRQCIELWPAPNADGYRLRIKGHFGLEPFTDDAHLTTIDPHPVFLFALGQAKAHYGKPDANNYFAQALNYIASLVAGSHHGARYVPHTIERTSAPRPRFLPLE